MRTLYIGQYTQGTTSRMRAKEIHKITKADTFDVIDTHVPFYRTNRLYRTIGFRYKLGPLIKIINAYIVNNVKESYYNLIWIDKGIFITYATAKVLRERTKILVHYTPDMAFYENRSSHFERAIHLYDYIITTKSAEIDNYINCIPRERLIVTTQGFSKDIHKAYSRFSDKDNAVVFIGLAEPSRFEMIKFLIENDIIVKLVGKGWRNFIRKYKDYENLIFIGESLYDEAYCKLISSSKFALGLVSKKFPEYHTTRTFEIPACGTALITERNIETSMFFDNDEVIFFTTKADILTKIKYYLENEDALELLSKKGQIKVNNKGYDYNSIFSKIIKQISIN